MNIQQKIDIVRCYFESGKNATSTIRFYKKENHLIKDPFDSRTVMRIVQRFLDTGTVQDHERSGRPSTSDEVVEEVRATIADVKAEHHYHQCSTTEISLKLGLPQSTVRKVKKLLFFD